MTESSPDGLMYQIVARAQEINRVASRLTGMEDGVFAPVSLEMPKFDPAELGFLRLASYLFVLYHEVGKVGVAFLVDRFDVYSLDGDGKLRKHCDAVKKLRTYLQHNLDPRKPHDKGIQEASECWLKEQCGTPIPGGELQWKKALTGVLEEAGRFLDAMLEAIRKIEGDESKEEICREWVFRVSRYHPPESFDELIFRVAADMGRDHIEPARMRRRYYEKWVEELSLLKPGYDFETEARRLIEHALLFGSTPVLPVDGRDIMEEFQIQPGPQVGQMLVEARAIYESAPCSREALLQKLREKTTSQTAAGKTEA